MSLAETWVLMRRQFILRLLKKIDGESSDIILFVGLEEGGFRRDPRSAFRADLDHLIAHGCLTDRWDDDVRIVTLTERGSDAAAGKITVTGVASERA